MPGLPSPLNIRYLRQHAQRMRLRFFMWTLLPILLRVGIVVVPIGFAIVGVARRIVRFALRNVQRPGPGALELADRQ